MKTIFAHVIRLTLPALVLMMGCGQEPSGKAPAQTSPAAGHAVADSSAALEQLTQAVRRFGVEQRRVPQTLQEVEAAGYLRGMPPAPAGKKFVIDPRHMQVVLANQ